jgi:DNA-binding response OmpR family regulator
LPARVLVVDRSPLVAEVTVQALRAAKYEVQVASDAASLELALTAPWDVVVMDPNQAWGFAERLPERLKALTFQPRLVLCGATSVEELRVQAAASGAAGFAPRTGGVEGLLAEVRRLAPPEAAAARRRRLLLVDDSATTTFILSQALTAKGFEVHTAESAEQATRIILRKETRPDLVLLDVQMPHVNGEQFCRFIKGNSLFAGIKVLLCSSTEPAELKRICREAGADGYLPKDAVLSQLTAEDA